MDRLGEGGVEAAMLWIATWLAVVPPEVQVQLEDPVQVQDSGPGDRAGEMTPPAEPVAARPAEERRSTVYIFLPYEEDWDVILDCGRRKEMRCLRDGRAWLFDMREHFMREMMQLAQDDLKLSRR